jgi:hypothetical protein
MKIKNIFKTMQIKHSTKGAPLAHYNVIAPNVRSLDWGLIYSSETINHRLLEFLGFAELYIVIALEVLRMREHSLPSML